MAPPRLAVLSPSLVEIAPGGIPGTDVRVLVATEASSPADLLAGVELDALLVELPADDADAATIVALRGLVPCKPLIALVPDEDAAGRALAAGAEEVVLRGEADADGIVRALRRAEVRVRRRAEREERLATASATDRLAAVGLLATGMAHEINNPLTYVLGNLDLAAVKLRTARRPGKTPQELEACADTVSGLLATASQGAQRVRTIVRDLNTYGQPAAEGGTSTASVRAALEWVIAIAAKQVEHVARVDTDFRPVPTVVGDEARLGQVFLALVLNAADAFAEPQPERNFVLVRTRATDRDVVVEIQDNGKGIPRDALPRVFEPFFTTKEVGHGTGLGLYVARNLVRGLGGNIVVESEAGAGTRVRVTLPAAAAPRPAPAPVPSGNARLLVLDDDPLVLEALRTQLAETYAVVAVSDVRGARERLADGAFDYLLCDLMMPDRSTIGFFQMLRSRRDPMARRVIFMTGGAFSPEARHFVRTIRNPCLTKPFTTEELARAMEVCRGLATAPSMP